MSRVPGGSNPGTIKCPAIGSTALIMVKELLYLARVDMKLTFSTVRDISNLQQT